MRKIFFRKSHMRRPAFTIVEVVIATAIVAAIAALAVPSYSAYALQQETTTNTQVVNDCVQKAHQAAMAVPAMETSYRYVEAYLVSDPGSQQVSCSVLYLSQKYNVLGAGPGKPLPDTDVFLIKHDAVVQADNTMIQDVSANGSGCTYIYPQQPGGSVRIIFGTLENGFPVAFSCANPDGSYTTITAAPGYVSSIPLGRGFEGYVHMVGANTFAGANTFRGNAYIRWDRLGFGQTSSN